MDKRTIHKNIALLLCGKFVSLFGSQIFNFTMGIFILTKTGSATSYGISLFIGGIPKVFLAPFAGSMVDSVSRKKTIVITDLLSGFTAFLLILLTGSKELNILSIYVCMFVLSVLNVYFNVAVSASIPSIAEKENLPRVYSLSQMITSSALILAPILAGVIIGFVDIKVFILINAVSFLLSSFSEVFIVFPAREKTQKKKSGVKASFVNIKEGYLYLKRNQSLYRIILFSILLNFFFSFGYTVPLPQVILNVLKLSSSQYGYIQSASSAGALCASLLFSALCKKINFDKFYLMFFRWIAIIMCIIGLITLPIFRGSSSVALTIILFTLSISFGMSVILSNIPMSVQIQTATEDEYRGRVQGFVQSASSAMSPIAMFLSGVCLDLAAPVWVCMGSGILMLLYISYFKSKSNAEVFGS